MHANLQICTQFYHKKYLPSVSAFISFKHSFSYNFLYKTDRHYLGQNIRCPFTILVSTDLSECIATNVRNIMHACAGLDKVVFVLKQEIFQKFIISIIAISEISNGTSLTIISGVLRSAFSVITNEYNLCLSEGRALNSQIDMRGNYVTINTVAMHYGVIINVTCCIKTVSNLWSLRRIHLF